MTLDELLTKTVPAPVANAIQDVIDIAGTSDASWSVLKAAGELVDRERNRADGLRRLMEVSELEPQWMDRPSGPGIWVCIGGVAGGIGRLQDSVLHLTQADLDRGAPFFVVRVYGPIPDYHAAKEANA